MKCGCGCGEQPSPGKTFVRGHWGRTDAGQQMYAKRWNAEPPNPSGLCMCGCGQPAPIAKVTNVARGRFRGHPMRYIQGHHIRGKRGADHPQWRGGRSITKLGYVFVSAPEHPAANRDGYVYEHRLVMEQKIGRLLAKVERVHHINGVRDDNRPENLALFASQSEHLKEHGVDGLIAYHAANPDAKRISGIKGAEARWKKHSSTS